ncbi:hypothetical protein E2562_010129 [Oryza meyeriana var. granulata]|uniref:Uncharacterized protein n=1 Tax=Oryza meyeriana var. granulata TaxID=110450 RepID=A0A6G1EJ97_9ORYZ|nr:hypothetical protein E2562_010129 [Oryza meyeriana var. granulata]
MHVAHSVRGSERGRRGPVFGLASVPCGSGCQSHARGAARPGASLAQRGVSARGPRRAAQVTRGKQRHTVLVKYVSSYRKVAD